MQHSSQITGVLAVVLMYLLSASDFKTSEWCIHPPSLPGGEEGVAHMQKLGGLPMCSLHGVAHSHPC